MNTQHVMYRAVWQMAAILCISAAVGLIGNLLRTDGIPLVGDWSPEAQLTLSTGENIAVSVHEARRMSLEGKAVIIDARSPEEYSAGHIDGSVNLPWLSFDEYFQIISDIPNDMTIITYCDGEACHLSKDLAIALTDFGFQVRVIVNGWSLWVQNGYPIKTGKENRS